MLKAEAERECIRRWRELPRHQRVTHDQAAAFAKSLMPEIVFETSGDRYHFILDWLRTDMQRRSTV